MSETVRPWRILAKQISGEPLAVGRGNHRQIRSTCRFDGETIWRSQALIGELFQRSKQTISEHLVNLFAEGELDEFSVVRNFRKTAADVGFEQHRRDAIKEESLQRLTETVKKLPLRQKKKGGER